jgi:hypothetical protein
MVAGRRNQSCFSFSAAPSCLASIRLVRKRNDGHLWQSYDRLCNTLLRTLASLFYFVSLVSYMAQQPRNPNIEAQRAAMKKLEFMVGKWAGEARLLLGPGDPV